MFPSSAIPSFLKSDQQLIPLTQGEIDFFEQVKRYISITTKYEDEAIQNKARSIVPWPEMTMKAVSKLLAMKQTTGSVSDFESGIDSRDILLIDLIDWFKNHFFNWFDAPKCATIGCNNQKMVYNSNAIPTQEEMRWSASRVEEYLCQTCMNRVRFPRYNNPEKLLETRIGRCGEWANCFTLICRALGYDARIVLDWTDHVWTEVYSQAQKRWLHCDTCENGCDSPLVYEAGWGKKLTFCIAITKFEVQDVSWRYSKDHEAMRNRRSLICRENWVDKVISKINSNIQFTLTDEQREERKLRRLLELVEFLRIPGQSDKDLKGSELQGRSSGGIAWRIARGECGKGQSCANKYQFDLPSEGNLRLTYNCVNDEYQLNTNDNNVSIKDWQSCSFECDNLFRKVEHDWQMVYLARNMSDTIDGITGKIIWKFKLNKNNVTWKRIKIIFGCKTYESASVKISLSTSSSNHSNNSTAIDIIPNEENVIDRDKLLSDVNHDSLYLRVILQGGSGSVGWQHAQLFRQSMRQKNESAFIVEFI